MKTITTAQTTLEQFIEQMRLLCIANKHTVKIKYNSEQAVASFYVKGSLVDTRTLFRL
jgi:hypothetical protein